jgi:hypothetical protein
MELTRYDLKNQALLERIAKALERIAKVMEAEYHSEKSDPGHAASPRRPMSGWQP